jgi:hypothetical protein
MTDTIKIQNASLSGMRDVYSGGHAPIEWFTAESLDALVAKLLNDHPFHANLAGELARRKKEFHSVSADKPIRMVTSFGSTLFLARDNPTCVYTFEASHPLWEMLMRTVNQKYFGGTLVVEFPNIPMTASFGDLRFKGMVRPFGAIGYMPEPLVDDLNAKHPYLREGDDGTLVVTGADLNDLLDVLRELNYPLYRELEAVRGKIIEAVPPFAPMILEFTPNRPPMVSSLARRSDRFIPSRTVKG